LAAQQGVGVLGVSNYYDYSVYGSVAAEARRLGVFPLFGLEIIALIDELVKGGVKINDPGNPGKMYICGKGITRFEQMTAEAQRLLGTIRRNDTQRMAAMVQRMAAVFEKAGVKTRLDAGAIIDAIVRRHDVPRETVYLQERHVAQAFQEAMFALVPAGERVACMTQLFGAAPKAGAEDAVKVQNEIRSHLMKAGKPGFVEEAFVNFDQAYRLILELGGVPCYPVLVDGTSPICPFEEPVEKLIEQLKRRQIRMAEFIPIRNAPEVLSRYVKAVRGAGLVVLGGTEHNTLDLLPMEPTCVKGVPVPEDVKEIFWEGACVVAAHQFLTLHGECGFTDSSGRPNGAYGTDEQRVAAFAKLGAAVITRYREKR
jgi:hypothetical protein